MTLTEEPTRTDDHPTAVEAALGQVVADLAAGLGCLLLGLGRRCGIWQAMDGAGGLTTAEVAARTGIIEPYAREWLRSQAAAGYLHYHPDADRFELPAPVADALLRGPGAAVADACLTMYCGIGADFAAYEAAFRSGAGFAWHQRSAAHWQGTDALTQASLSAEMFAEIIGAIPGVPDALRRGGRVADIGCGFGAPTRMIAAAFPAATVVGFDYHDASIAAARRAAAAAGVSDRVGFEVASADGFPGTGYTLITFVDSLHDLGDPEAALRHARSALAPDGAVLLVEPAGADRVADNLTPLGRMYYGVSTLVCTPNAVAQAGRALGTLAGEATLREVAAAAGFTTVRRLPAPTPMNMMLELRG
jgi:SAM-dependent methyltransferase